MSQAAPLAQAPAAPLMPFAADILGEGHPLHKMFLNFCGVNPPTKRKARAFLRQPLTIKMLEEKQG